MVVKTILAFDFGNGTEGIMDKSVAGLESRGRREWREREGRKS